MVKLKVNLEFSFEFFLNVGNLTLNPTMQVMFRGKARNNSKSREIENFKTFEFDIVIY
jgi:hypothetical protein